MTVINNIIIITNNPLYVAIASSSKYIDTCHTTGTPTFITKVLHLVLLLLHTAILNDFYSELTAYTVL